MNQQKRRDGDSGKARTTWRAYWQRSFTGERQRFISLEGMFAFVLRESDAGNDAATMRV